MPSSKSLARAGLILLALVVGLAQFPSAWGTLKSWYRDAFGAEQALYGSDPVVSPEEVQKLAAQGLRGQVVSIDEQPEELDQKYEWIAIGVGQRNLEAPESTDEDVIMVTGSRIPGLPPEMVPTSTFYGRFNNVVLYNRKTGELIKVFDKRVAVSQFQLGWLTTRPVLVIFGAENDNNHDGVLGREDKQDVYVYLFDERRLARVELPHASPDSVLDIPEVDFVAFSAHYDRNSDGVFDSQTEPTFIYRIDLSTLAVSLFVPEAMLMDMQKTLDGGAAAQPPAPQAPSEGQ